MQRSLATGGVVHVAGEASIGIEGLLLATVAALGHRTHHLIALAQALAQAAFRLGAAPLGGMALGLALLVGELPGGRAAAAEFPEAGGERQLRLQGLAGRLQPFLLADQAALALAVLLLLTNILATVALPPEIRWE